MTPTKTIDGILGASSPAGTAPEGARGHRGRRGVGGLGAKAHYAGRQP